MFKKNDIVICKKEFSRGECYYKPGDVFTIRTLTKIYLELVSKYGTINVFRHQLVPAPPSNYYWEYFYSEQELRRLKIEKYV